MKTTWICLSCRSDEHNMFSLKRMVRLSLIPVFIMIMSSCTVYQDTGQRPDIIPPPWAPYYDDINMVRYYYFPDIECYYDVWNREFVYFEDGSWMFGATLPPSYAWYNLNTAYVVMLDRNVYEPWRHFNYYVSHYPRYYYMSYYRDRFNDISHPIRGFDENTRGVVYRNSGGPEGRDRNYIENRDNRQNVSVTEQRNENAVRNEVRNNTERRDESTTTVNVNREYPERRVVPTRPPEQMQYNGREIGRPVRVQQNMTRPRESRRK